MRDVDREIGRLRAKLPAYRSAVDRSLDIIRGALDAYPDLYVSFSCGKDSAVMFDLVRDVAPAVEGRFLRWPETAWIGDFDRVLSDWTGLGATVRVVDIVRDRIDDRVPDRWGQLADAAPSSGAFIGLRSQESRTRAMVLRRFGPVHVMRSGIVRVWPIGHWTEADIAARIWERGLPILSAYDAGIDVRTVARVPRESVRESFMADLRDRNPAGWAAIRAIYSTD